MYRKFFLSWIFSSVSMFVLSYMWHAYILTDLERYSGAKKMFLIFAVIVYLIIGGIIAKIYELKSLEKKFIRKPIMKGVVIGIILGIVCYLISTVIGISFKTETPFKNIVLDFGWQMVEQGLGGGVVALMHMLVVEKEFVDD